HALARVEPDLARERVLVEVGGDVDRIAVQVRITPDLEPWPGWARRLRRRRLELAIVVDEPRALPALALDEQAGLAGGDRERPRRRDVDGPRRVAGRQI